MELLTLDIIGMSCGHCVGSVRAALASLAGIEVLDVQIGKATLRMDPECTTRAQIVDAIEGQGYEVL